MRKTALALGLLTAAVAWSGAQSATVAYKATLSGAQEVPPVAGPASGSAAVNVDTATKQASWTVTYNGLSGPPKAAHIHCGGAAGANGPVAVPIASIATSPSQGSGAMTDAQLADLQAGKCYVNIHTEKNPNGELRGQLTP